MSPTAPNQATTKDGKKITKARVILAFAMIGVDRVNIGLFISNVFDKFKFMQCVVDFDGKPIVEGSPGGEVFVGYMKFMYPNLKRRLLENAGHAWPGPTYLPLNTPVWKMVVDMNLGKESVEQKSIQIDAIRAQIVRLLDGQPDKSNPGNQFKVTVVEREVVQAEWPMLLCLR
jgi:hypothetical protein